MASWAKVLAAKPDYLALIFHIVKGKNRLRTRGPAQFEESAESTRARQNESRGGGRKPMKGINLTKSLNL